MPSTKPAPLTPKHPLLRLAGRQALSQAADEHAADIVEWQQRLVALHEHLSTSSAPPDWAWAAAELISESRQMDPAAPWEPGLERIIVGYRRLCKLAALCRTADSWQSPSIADSGVRQRAPSQEPVLAFQNDYQRYALPVGPAEAALQALHLPVGGISPCSWLFSSGMAALATLLHALQAEADGVWLCGSHLYFESQRLLQGRPVHRVDETDPRAFLTAITREGPQVVVVDGLANSSRLPTLDLGAVIGAMAALPGQTIRTLLVDTTLLGPAWEPVDWLQGRSLPGNLRLVAYRSLQKLDQHGLDLTTGGEVTVWSAVPWNLEGWRQVCGSLPTEAGLQLLPLPDRAAWLRRFARHERNTQLLGAWLAELRSPWLGTVYLADGRLTGGHAGPLFWVDWADDLEGADAQRFCQSTVEVARTLTASLAYGSSFGFATTRLAAFTRSGGTGTALRLAPGVENLARLARVADALQQSLASFGAHLADSYRQDATTTWYRRWRDVGSQAAADPGHPDGCRTMVAVLSPLAALSGRCRLDPALQAIGVEAFDRLIAPIGKGVAQATAWDRAHAEDLRHLAELLLALEQTLSPPRRRWWQR